MFAKSYDRRFGSWYKWILQILQSMFDSLDDVLEIGCGSGLVAFEIMSYVARYVGFDSSEAMIRIANEKLSASPYANATFLRGDAMHPPDLGLFDKVLLINLLHVVDDPSTILRQAKTYLKPSGRIVILDYCHGEKMTPKYRFLSWMMQIGSKLRLMAKLHRFTFQELDTLVIQEGLTIEGEARIEEGFPFLCIKVR
jgi:ubiquinone/menaquinone biosynthesis C-methylase UbiE